MEEKYFSLSDIRHDFKRLESNGWEDIPYKEVLERMEYGAIDPADDVAPVVHAKIIHKPDGYGGDLYICSNCNSKLLHPYIKYCYECGAKMDMEESE